MTRARAMEAPLKRKVCATVLEPKSLAQLQFEVEMRVRVDRKAEVIATAACMRRELEQDLEEEEWERESRRQLIADAKLLLQLSRTPPAPMCKPLRIRCGECDNCVLGDCGECGNCLDKRRYGGRGVRKQACSKRRCMEVKASEKRVFS